MAIQLYRRKAARTALIKLDNSSRLRKFPTGAYVYFTRSQVRPGESPQATHRWFGIARIIGHELPRILDGQ
eukprot:1885916-Heterocapsa_arctica.AAC.1